MRANGANWQQRSWFSVNVPPASLSLNFRHFRLLLILDAILCRKRQTEMHCIFASHFVVACPLLLKMTLVDPHRVPDTENPINSRYVKETKAIETRTNFQFLSIFLSQLGFADNNWGSVWLSIFILSISLAECTTEYHALFTRWITESNSICGWVPN